MNTEFEVLNTSHSALINKFSCAEDNEFLMKLDFNKKARQRIASHNQNIDVFLKTEALLEQNKNLNITHLLINKDENELIGFVSLCNDCIPLEIEEKEGYDFTYGSIPALKIARLAIDTKYQHKGFSQEIFQYAIYQAIKIRENSGLAFMTLDCYKHRLSFYVSKFGFIKNGIQTNSTAINPPISMRLHINKYLDSIAK